MRERLTAAFPIITLALHVLRAPLTSLRLNLVDLVGDPTMSAEARGLRALLPRR